MGNSDLALANQAYKRTRLVLNEHGIKIPQPYKPKEWCKMNNANYSCPATWVQYYINYTEDLLNKCYPY